MKIFQSVPKAKIQRSTFDLTHERKMSIDMGKLYPCFLQEVVPGDNFSIKTQSLIRMSPLVSPVMHRMNVYIHYFYVPNHVIWDGWDEFVSQDFEGLESFGPNGDHSAYDLVPSVELAVVNEGTLADYLGLPVGNFGSLSPKKRVNALPFGAYLKIYNEYYRDENLGKEYDFFTDFVNYTPWESIGPFYRAWRKDYFTSCLPFAQKGASPGIPVELTPPEPTHVYIHGNNPAAAGALVVENGHLADDASAQAYLEPNTGEVSIQDIRLAEKIQRYLEKLYRSGHRYVEYLRGVWGQDSDDLRLMRPQYIGGGVSPVVVSEVLNTSATATEPQGNMSGHAINVGVSNEARCFCKYHGWIMGILSVVPEPVYQDGLHRMFTRFDPFDYYIPDLAQAGEQEVLKQELCLAGLSTGYNEQIFGYQSRFAEYKYGLSSLHGAFRSSLSHWTLARKFDWTQSTPALNEAFLKCEPSTDIFAVPNIGENEQMYVTLLHEVIAQRPMPFFNVPSI